MVIDPIQHKVYTWQYLVSDKVGLIAFLRNSSIICNDMPLHVVSQKDKVTKVHSIVLSHTHTSTHTTILNSTLKLALRHDNHYTIDP